ncbi:hypothetical protein COCOBI_07-0580 [Coccomyxa sp. Obi]|nr:hypothetical protein COCOBI_07-0580 [Coccomyxa sp. Obi]
MTKPCYRFGKDLLVLARVTRKEDDSWHLCKAHIGPGICSGTTKMSQDFATRVGWSASEAKDRNCQPNSGRHCASDQPPERFSCSLAVGGCQIETLVEIMVSPVPPESKAAFEWHMHIGEADFKALERSGWDSQICYAVPQRGLPSRPPECPSGCTSVTDALGSGHADCMRYWHGGPNAVLADNVTADDHDAIRLSKQQHPSCKEAARWPSAEALMYVHDVLGLDWDAGTCAAAADAGSDACLSYAFCSGCPWRKDVCSNAAAEGSMACLVYAHKHGCEWDGYTCAAAALHGHLDCLVYARTHGCRWDEATCEEAAAGGNLKILAYAHENGCRWDKGTCAAAAYSDSLECLVYAHERGCPWEEDTCACAAEGQSLRCLRYAHEQGCRWNEGTLFGAARVCNLDCLMYAHTHGCPYDPAPALRGCAFGLTVRAARRRGKMSLPCLKYIHESMGWGWDTNPEGTEWRYALWEGRLDVLEYIYLHGGVQYGEEGLIEQKGELDSTCPTSGDPDVPFDGKARCLLYMYCWGDCELPPLRGTKVGEQVLALMWERRAAVLLSFRAARRAQAGGRSADAAHAAMEMVPLDLIKEIMCLAKLLPAD